MGNDRRLQQFLHALKWMRITFARLAERAAPFKGRLCGYQQYISRTNQKCSLRYLKRGVDGRPCKVVRGCHGTFANECGTVTPSLSG